MKYPKMQRCVIPLAEQVIATGVSAMLLSALRAISEQAPNDEVKSFAAYVVRLAAELEDRGAIIVQ